MENNEILENIDFIKQRNRALMPDFMKEEEAKWKAMTRPDAISLKKIDYIDQWYQIFCGVSDDFQSEDIKNRFMSYSILQLQTAFNYSLEHFHELALGGNYRWYGVAMDILKLLKKGRWNAQTENILIANYITDTPWFDY